MHLSLVESMNLPMHDCKICSTRDAQLLEAYSQISIAYFEQAISAKDDLTYSMLDLSLENMHFIAVAITFCT